jgi:hypothetical protein
MHHQQNHMFLRQAREDRDAQERPTLQVEWSMRQIRQPLIQQ